MRWLRPSLWAAAVVSVPVLWTAAASMLLVKLLGSEVANYYSYDRLETYWQWWAYLADPEEPASVNKWLLASAAAPALVAIALIFRWVVDFWWRKPGVTQAPLYGETHMASPMEMIAGGLSLKQRLHWKKK